MKRCTVCGEEKPLADFFAAKHRPGGYGSDCKECSVKRVQRWRAKNREKANRRSRQRHAADQRTSLLASAKIRARSKGLPFSLSKADIVVPVRCPALGIPLFSGTGVLGDNSPTVDRIVPNLGYIPGNIAVISHRANRIKCDASPTELRRVARWMDKLATLRKRSK